MGRRLSASYDKHVQYLGGFTMHEYDNVRDCLKDLLTFNDTRNKDFRVKDEDGTEHEATVKDLQELNTEALYNLADLLGMSDLYLNATTSHKE